VRIEKTIFFVVMVCGSGNGKGGMKEERHHIKEETGDFKQ
jgi:hypothetical protein